MVAIQEERAVALMEEPFLWTPSLVGRAHRFPICYGAGRHDRPDKTLLRLSEFALARDEDQSDMARLVSGDQNALESLMRRYAKKLFRHLARMARNSADVWDLVQEAFVRVYRYRERYDFAAKFSTWLFAIGTNLARDLLRRRARRPSFLPLHQIVEANGSDLPETLIDPAPNPSAELEAVERLQKLDLALARLPRKWRMPIVLVAFDGCSQGEIATSLHCSIKAVEMRLYYGRQRLRWEWQRILEPRLFGSATPTIRSKPQTEKNKTTGKTT